MQISTMGYILDTHPVLSIRRAIQQVQTATLLRPLSEEGVALLRNHFTKSPSFLNSLYRSFTIYIAE